MRATLGYKQKTYPLSVNSDTSDLALLALGRFESMGNFRFAQLARFHSMHVIHSGEGVFTADETKHRVGANQIFTFFPSQLIRYHDFPETPWVYTWLNFSGENIARYLASVGITKENPVLDLSGRLMLKSTLALVVNEIVRYNAIEGLDYKLYHYRTNHGAKIDLVIQKNMKSPPVAVEIKSSVNPTEVDVKQLIDFAEEFPEARRLVICHTSKPYRINGIDFLPFQEGIKEIFK